MKLYGTPQVLDAVLRPMVRVAQVVVGGTASAILALLSEWWWMPLPLAGSFFVYEFLFWMRGDRPIVVELNDHLIIRDRKRKLTVDVDPRRVTTATAHRRLAGDNADIRVVLTNDKEVLVAVWFRVPAHTPSLPREINADLMDHVVGGDYGSLRALAPGYRLARQRVDTTAKAIDWLRNHIPADAWERSAARLWAGHAPELDLLGHHHGDESTFAVFDGQDVRLNGESQPVVWVDGSRSERVAVLLHANKGLNDTFAADRLSLAVLNLGALRLATPSRILMAELTITPTDEDLQHTHPAEAAGVLIHLLRTHERSSWPDNIQVSVDEALALCGKSALDI
ncbi:MAG: hypothetical protein ACJATT_002163 [Myxococcota bacterium]|jgi:hypothetical protein